MKRVLVIFAAIFIYSMAQSQEFVYCQLVGQGKLFSNKVTVEFDYGQQAGFFADRRLMDENGKPIVFNSMVDAMNFMGADGWEFVQAYAVTTGNVNVYHWLLKKRVDLLTPEEKADVLKRLKTKKQ
ncbi:MAG: hypothetical protein FWC39_12955 [Bacteroidetes bacterium]|nr:hypothetical protein [Bacteroidota bacterium]